MENNRKILKPKSRKTQQKSLKVESQQNEEGFCLFSEENYSEENFFEDFKRLRIEDSGETFEDNDCFSKKQRNGENLIFEFQILNKVEQKEIQNQCCFDQQNYKKEIDSDNDRTSSSTFDDYQQDLDDLPCEIKEIDYIKELYGNEKKSIVKRKTSLKKEKKNKLAQVLLKHQIVRY